MIQKKGRLHRKAAFSILGIFICLSGSAFIRGESLDFPSKKWGISFGNSKEFTGLRFNFRDSQVKCVNGINVTLWQARKDNGEASVNGLSLGLIAGAGRLNGIQLGLLGVAAEKKMAGLSLGLLGIGSGGDMVGVNIGGIGAGCGQNLIGLNIGGLGVGAGQDLRGINIGLLGAGAGRDVAGINIGGLGIGAGRNLAGINIGGLGAGAGEKLIGLTICGLGAGAPEVQGVTVGGLGVGGNILKGVQLALGTVRVENDGHMIGFSASAFNHIRGTQTGLTIGLVNYARRLKGVQIGLINIVRDNPKYMKILPILNANFRD
ncbi:MAG: hypothetical protein WCC06_09675 [Candidatus Aminicenantales bacterium]